MGHTSNLSCSKQHKSKTERTGEENDLELKKQTKKKRTIQWDMSLSLEFARSEAPRIFLLVAVSPNVHAVQPSGVNTPNNYFMVFHCSCCARQVNLNRFSVLRPPYITGSVLASLRFSSCFCRSVSLFLHFAHSILSPASMELCLPTR